MEEEKKIFAVRQHLKRMAKILCRALVAVHFGRRTAKI
jgi:hypothetical protein